MRTYVDVERTSAAAVVRGAIKALYTYLPLVRGCASDREDAWQVAVDAVAERVRQVRDDVLDVGAGVSNVRGNGIAEYLLPSDPMTPAARSEIRRALAISRLFRLYLRAERKRLDLQHERKMAREGHYAYRWDADHEAELTRVRATHGLAPLSTSWRAP